MRLRHHLLVGVLAAAACRGTPALGPAITVADREAANATVAVDGRSGTVFVAFAQKGADSVWTVWLVRADSAGRMAPPARMSHGPEEVMIATENPPQVVVGDDGAVYVAWVSAAPAFGRTPKDIHIRIARSTDGGGSFHFVASPGDALIHPTRANLYYDLAAGPGGSLDASWLDLRFYTDSLASHEIHQVPDSIPVPESRVELRVAHSPDRGESFTAAAVLDTTACICCRTAITVDANGGVHAMWRHVFPGSVRDFVLATSRNRAQSFAPPARVHEDQWVLDGCPDIGPAVAVDARDVVHAAWYTGAPGRVGLWYARSTDGGVTFADPVPLLGKGHISPSHVRLVAAGDAVFGAWEDRRPTPNRVMFGTPGRGAAAVVGSGEFPALAVAGNTLAVTWMDGGAVRLRVAQLKTGLSR